MSFTAPRHNQTTHFYPSSSLEYQPNLDAFTNNGGNDDEDVSLLDYDCSPEEVISRIETCCIWLVQQVAQGILPDFTITLPQSATSQNNADPSDTESPPHFMTTTRTLVGRHPDSADRFARLFTILNICHESLLRNNPGVTQREIHYRCKPLGVFNGSTTHLNDAVQDAVLLLRVPRYSLGISCSSKGLVSGPLILQDTNTNAVTECSALSAPQGRPIPGDVGAIGRLHIEVAPEVTAIVVVEKDTVFQQLISQQSQLDVQNVVFVTGKGVPDIATRAFLSSLTTSYPHLPLLGFVDWNPAGLNILCLYKFGKSQRMAESQRYALPGLCWLGVRASCLAQASGQGFQPLNMRDKSLIPGLKGKLQGVDGAQGWLEELAAMEATGSKADIEAMYSALDENKGVLKMVMEQIKRKDWV